MINRETDTAQIRNGNVITGHTETPTPQGIVQVPQLYWIRSRTSSIVERNIMLKEVRCEDVDGNYYNFPLQSILEGRYAEIHFDGVFSPRELRRQLRSKNSGVLVIDPIELRRYNKRLSHLQETIRQAFPQ